jgi:hypothetical protein
MLSPTMFGAMNVAFIRHGVAYSPRARVLFEGIGHTVVEIQYYNETMISEVFQWLPTHDASREGNVGHLI